MPIEPLKLQLGPLVWGCPQTGFSTIPSVLNESHQQETTRAQNLDIFGYICIYLDIFGDALMFFRHA